MNCKIHLLCHFGAVKNTAYQTDWALVNEMTN
jgi:hypothetical protein